MIFGEVIFIRELEDKILSDGEVLPGGVLKVGGFLNQQIDVPFLMTMGEEIARLYKDSKVTKVLTVEASGIAVAVAAAAALGVPMVFAKKHKSLNLSNDLIRASVYSFTHKMTYDIVVSREYIRPDDNILIVDDFLAQGNAILGMLDLIEQAKASCAGAAIAIEKGFQDGGKMIRDRGIRVESLAIIKSMDDNGLTFESR